MYIYICVYVFIYLNLSYNSCNLSIRSGLIKIKHKVKWMVKVVKT